MPTIVVDVMPKAELLDPAGKAVAGSLARQGKAHISGVRIGKRFEITVDEVNEAVLAEVREIAESMLSNSVIEDVIDVRVAEDHPAANAGEAHAEASVSR
ncbi:phosphoribosylformylglycinamidine synthase subunit PurS [Ruicaihuangia caeni]|uniref:Phosphoribosylformylglycinamidine synthase subunit PurS n=1 Tax=Ruicaihuangia caeni TaxID=3042517 RepID=A0AAW6T3J1_9MICO|nr:phosphoribosylformylglycinamidine synthase subunit PurS [Klugiella sp. YN-L-19]MDI2098391.1 phosphoribosylformylglycinamidine synthase subunit PurS [Klugiella sp. YN-L-19]